MPMDLTSQTQVKAISLCKNIWTLGSKYMGYLERLGATSHHTRRAGSRTVVSPGPRPPIAELGSRSQTGSFWPKSSRDFT